MDYTDEQILEVMGRLGVTQADIVRARASEADLRDFQDRVRQAYRKLALELHPDRTGNDAYKSQLFQLATQVVDEIKSMQPIKNNRRVKWAVRLKAVAVEG